MRQLGSPGPRGLGSLGLPAYRPSGPRAHGALGPLGPWGPSRLGANGLGTQGPSGPRAWAHGTKRPLAHRHAATAGRRFNIRKVPGTFFFQEAIRGVSRKMRFDDAARWSQQVRHITRDLLTISQKTQYVISHAIPQHAHTHTRAFKSYVCESTQQCSTDSARQHTRRKRSREGTHGSRQPRIIRA